MNYEELYKQIRAEFENYKLKVWKKQQHRLPSIDIDELTAWLEEHVIAVASGATIIGSAAYLISALASLLKRDRRGE